MDFFSQLQAATDSERQEFLGAPVIQQTLNGVVALETYIAFLEDFRFEDPLTATTFPQRVCFDVSLTPTP